MKRYLLISAVTFVTALFAYDSADAETPFSDVSESFWAEEEVAYLNEEDVLTGYENGTFGVNDPMTRAQAARALARVHDLDTSEPESVSFEDVQKGDSAYPEIAAAVEAGYFSDGETFQPHETITRAQMAAILSRAYDLTGEETVDYKDVPEDHWAYDDIRLLGEHRLTTGYDDLTFRPAEDVTRSQFSVFLARAEEESFRADAAVLPQRAAEGVYYPRMVGLEDAVQESINTTLNEQGQASAEESEEVEELAQDANGELAEDYVYEETYRIEQNNDEYISIVFEEYQFTGGVHGMSQHTAYTFDAQTGETLTLQDLFAEDTDYVSVINETIETEMEDEALGGSYFDFDGVEPETDQFYVTEKGPVVYFQPYEIAPYAEGIPTFTVPWDEF
ncbi:DUF3298 domain-containing protein [Salibacterium salarium]|uniref:DUF3298 domain-containing protein n=1 Tax=Salibacterium salarium TaxID=284579 RepID=A0A428MZ42_9BACI|nr:S-layer homology domain-containing protein [Salibacterium salarium]RSL31423.1 DUF3298 domain-containing protein [Salibacterium salarium]